MSKDILVELEKFLKASKLSSYEIRAYMTLINSGNLTAKEISRRADIPSGRIYDVLEELHQKEMIEIQDSRPKIYKVSPPTQAFNNLIENITKANKRRLTKLSNQAKLLESHLKKTNLMMQEDTPRIFWSTAYGWKEVFELYVKKFSDVKEELLMTGFINQNTPKILHLAKPFFAGIKNVLNKGIQVKYLWSFDYDPRPLTDDLKKANRKLFEKVIEKVIEKHNFPSIPPDNLKMRFINQRIPNYFDIFDKKRVIIKLQDPLNPSRFYAAMNVLDPNLAHELRNKFYEIWLFAN